MILVRTSQCRKVKIVFDLTSRRACHWVGPARSAPVIASVPVIAGEIGENDCADDYIDPLMAYLDSKGASCLA